MAPFAKADNLEAAKLVLLDYTLWIATALLSAWYAPPWIQLLLALPLGLLTARLFILGHDAAHGSLFTSDRLNHRVGRAVFLPSLTPFSLWQIGHNLAHHGWTNLVGRDFVWAPWSPEQFAAATPGAQLIYRLYRSGIVGHGLYYLIDVWWNRMIRRDPSLYRSVRPEYARDRALILTFLVVQLLMLVALPALYAGRSWLSNLLLVVLLPFVAWNITMGTVIFVHHTGLDSKWFNDPRQWDRARSQWECTTNSTLPLGLHRILHGIMVHTVHHIDTRVPLYRLSGAAVALGQRYPAEFPQTPQQCDWRALRSRIKTCKVYDFATFSWSERLS